MFVQEITITIIICYGLIVNVVQVSGNVTDGLVTVIGRNETIYKNENNNTIKEETSDKILYRFPRSVQKNATSFQNKTDVKTKSAIARNGHHQHSEDHYRRHHTNQYDGRLWFLRSRYLQEPNRDKRQVNYLWSQRRFLKDALYNEDVTQEIFERQPRNYPDQRKHRRSFIEPKAKGKIRNKVPQDDDDFRKPTMRMQIPSKGRLKSGKDFHSRKSTDSFHTITKKTGKKENTIVRFEPEKIRGYNVSDSTFNIETSFSEGDLSDPKNRIKCSAATDGTISGTRGKIGDSRSQAFSEHTDDDKKTLLCKSETSEVVKPNKDVTIKYRVRGSTILTNDRNNPSKFLDRNVDARNDDLELGTMSRSIIHENSVKNSSGSVINAHDKYADSLSQTRSRLVHETDRFGSGIQTSGNADGSTNFDPLHGKPLVMTSKSQETSMVMQNPSRHLSKPLRTSKDEDIKMYATQKKSTTFDIAFRSLEVPIMVMNPHKEKRPG